MHIGITEKIDRGYPGFKDYISSMNRYGLSGALVMPNISSVISADELNRKFWTDYLSIVMKWAGVFYPFLLIDPHSREIANCIRGLAEDFDRRYLKGLKYHPSLYRVEIDDNSLNRYIDIAEIHNLVILVHCGRDKKSHISHLIRAARKWKHITFIAAHMGGNASELVEEAIGLLVEAGLENIWLDTSSIKLPWLIEIAVKKLGDERIIFGSDEPYADFSVCWYCLKIANISDASKERIFYENIERLFFFDYAVVEGVVSPG